MQLVIFISELFKAKLACKILRNSVIVKVRKCLVPTATCTVNGGSIVGADGATYTFFFCTEVSAIGGGNGYSDKCLGTPPVLPTASDDPVVLQFCDPQWVSTHVPMKKKVPCTNIANHFTSSRQKIKFNFCRKI